MRRVSLRVGIHRPSVNLRRSHKSEYTPVSFHSHESITMFVVNLSAKQGYASFECRRFLRKFLRLGHAYCTWNENAGYSTVP
jgi:hypothetical protein